MCLQLVLAKVLIPSQPASLQLFLYPSLLKKIYKKSCALPSLAVHELTLNPVTNSSTENSISDQLGFPNVNPTNNSCKLIVKTESIINIFYLNTGGHFGHVINTELHCCCHNIAATCKSLHIGDLRRIYLIHHKVLKFKVTKKMYVMHVYTPSLHKTD